MLVLVTNLSTLATEEQVQKMAEALQVQLTTHLAPSWDRLPSECRYAPMSEPSPKPNAEGGVLRIFLVDAPPSTEDPGILGYHTEGPDGQKYSYVFCKPVLDNGGGVLDQGTAGVSVASVVSHEGCEGFVNLAVNRWVDGPVRKEGGCYAFEVCDPVESNGYWINLPDGTKVWMSAFVTPEWFDEEAPVDEPRSYPDIGINSFELAEGGYAEVRAAPGTETQVFHEVMPPPAWKMEMKRVNPSSRGKKMRGEHTKLLRPTHPHPAAPTGDYLTGEQILDYAKDREAKKLSLDDLAKLAPPDDKEPEKS
jgi:hypothetical protein